MHGLTRNNMLLLEKLYVCGFRQPALNQTLQLLFVYLELISYEVSRLRFVTVGALCPDNHPAVVSKERKTVVPITDLHFELSKTQRLK